MRDDVAVSALAIRIQHAPLSGRAGRTGPTSAIGPRLVSVLSAVHAGGDRAGTTGARRALAVRGEAASLPVGTERATAATAIDARLAAV